MVSPLIYADPECSRNVVPGESGPENLGDRISPFVLLLDPVVPVPVPVKLYPHDHGDVFYLGMTFNKNG